MFGKKCLVYNNDNDYKNQAVVTQVIRVFMK